MLRRLLLCIIALAVIGTHTALGADWYRYRGPALNGISSETEWSEAWGKKGPAILWKQNVGTGLSGVVVSNNRAYTIGNSENVDTVHCLDATTGKSIWHYDYECPTDPNEFEGGPTSTPTIDGEVVFTLSRLGDLHCFNKASGALVWRRDVARLAKVRAPGWGFAGSPLVVGDLLLINAGDAGVAVKKQSGDLVWSSADKSAGYSSMVPIKLGEKDAVVFGSGRSYVCVEVKSGAELWRQRWVTTFGCNAADPILIGDYVFVSSGYNRGCALLKPSEKAVEVVWENKEMQNQISSCVLIDGFLYGIHGSTEKGAELRCMEALTGEVKWIEPPLHAGAISAAGNRLIILTNDGELVVANASPTGFSVSARHPVIKGRCWTAPVLSKGKIYCRSAEGEIVCLDVTPANPN
jgi:outer membrane protein assembly factor BamB